MRYLLFLAYFLVTTDSWFSNAGIEGSVPLFLLCPVITAMILLNGWPRLGMIIGVLLHLTLLTLLQQADPTQVRAYPTTATKEADMLVSLLFVTLYCMGYIVIVRRHLEQRRVQTENLVLNLLPASVAETLKYPYTMPQTVADYFPQASIMFVDVVDFTALAAKMEPAELITFLNELFSHLDMLVDAYGVEKIKVMGDCYMVAAGVPYPRADHAQRLARLALTIQEHAKRRHFLGHKLTLRIGINSGPVVAGIIGHQKFTYDLWGDAVNLASRMQSQGQAGSIQIPRATYELIADEFLCEAKGTIQIKGKTEMEIWHIKGVQPTAVAATATLPNRLVHKPML
ncbi:MAG: adenylate/guanylate cyclase domain-containing protein [Caldilineaceae bacterium]|nr:adenylate/guanylate cyclase domain-containing protein [Caldilineaceae bacterium]